MIRIGDYDHSSKFDDSNAKDLSINNVTIHPNYNGKSAYFDVAIFETETILFSKAISPVCLPQSPSEDIKKYELQYLELLGWGQKNLFGMVSSTLKRVSLKIHPQW